MFDLTCCRKAVQYRLQWLAVALVFVWPASEAMAQNLVVNPSFETEGLPNWTAIGAATMGEWISTNDAIAVTDGSFGVRTRYSDPGTEILYQDVTLPAAGTYTFQIATGCLAKDVTDFCRVDITDTDPATLDRPPFGSTTLAATTALAGAHILVPVYLHDGTGGNAAIADTAVINISALAGQTVRIRLMAGSSAGNAIGYGTGLADNVRLLPGVPPVVTGTTSVPTLSEWGLILMALLLAGLSFREFDRRNGRGR